MNKVVLMGRLTKDPVVSYYAQKNEAGAQSAVARYTLAVDRRYSKAGNNGGSDQQTADFISCVAFGKTGEFAEKFLHKGTKIVVTGRIQTGSYTNKDGQKVYTTDVVVEEHEFAESKNAQGNGDGFSNGAYTGGQGDPGDGFMNIPSGIDDEIPFT